MAKVDREAHRRRAPQPGLVALPADRAAQIAAQEPERRYRLAGAPGRFDDGSGFGVGMHEHAVGGQRPGSPQAAFLDRHGIGGSALAGDSGCRRRSRPPTTRRRRPGTVARAASAAARPVPSSGATSADLAEKVDELLDVADEVAAGQVLVVEHRRRSAPPPAHA